jgi:tetratricopeptide (TPR) repeat protein
MHAILSRACLMAADDEGSRRHVAAAQAGGPTVEAANAVGVQLLLQGRYDQARVELLAALALCRQRGGHQEVAILNNVGVACMDDRRLDEAAHWLQECAALARARGDRGRESTALGNLAVVARHQGRLDEAETGFGRARALAQANERPAFAELWRMNRAIIDILRGRLEPAIDELTQTVAVFHELDDASDALTARLWLVVAETLRGRHGPEALRDFAPQAERAGKPTLATAARLLDRLHHLSTRQGRNDARAAAAQATGDGAIHTAGQLLRIQADRAERAG